MCWWGLVVLYGVGGWDGVGRALPGCPHARLDASWPNCAWHGVVEQSMPCRDRAGGPLHHDARGTAHLDWARKGAIVVMGILIVQGLKAARSCCASRSAVWA